MDIPFKGGFQLIKVFGLIEAPLQVYNNWFRAEGDLQWNVQPIVSILFLFIINNKYEPDTKL